MIEFVYALVCSKCINNGDVDIKEVMEFVEHIFGIDTGDFYRTYVELRQRNNRTKFLDRLKASLLAKMDEDDEKDFIDPLAKRK
jgi:predicted nucleic-acid-binding protein